MKLWQSCDRPRVGVLTAVLLNLLFFWAVTLWRWLCSFHHHEDDSITILGNVSYYIFRDTAL